MAEILGGEWLDPDGGKVPLIEYVNEWVKQRDLKPHIREKYERHVRLHLRPQFDARLLIDVTRAMIRSWRTDLLAAGVGASAVAKTYRILTT